MENELDGFVPYEVGSVGRPLKNNLLSKSKFTSQPGCYAVNVKVSGKIYVGSTSNLAGRVSKNVNKLKHNKHHSKDLQEAYNKNPDIEIMVMPTDTVEEARRLEQEVVNKFLPSGNLTNKAIEDVTRPGVGLTHSEETRLKMSVAKLGSSHKPHSDETKQKISEAQLGKSRSEETKQKMSATKKEYFATDEGKAAHASLVEKISHSVIIDGVTYPSLTEAGKALGVHYTTITYRCNSDNFPSYFKQE